MASNFPGVARNDSRSPSVSADRSAVIRVDLLILIGLALAFSIVTANAFSKLRSAFVSAYRDRAEYQTDRQTPAPAPNKPTEKLHAEYFRSEVVLWDSAIQRWSTETGLPPDLIAIVMQIESCGYPRARSSAGAIGVFQVMPFHFGSGEDPFDPEINAKRGLAYLAKGYELSEGQIDRTLAGYNGGHSQIERSPDQWPAETQRYVHWGIGIWKDIQTGRNPSPTLERWLEAGGARLCASASATALQPAD